MHSRKQWVRAKQEQIAGNANKIYAGLELDALKGPTYMTTTTRQKRLGRFLRANCGLYDAS